MLGRKGAKLQRVRVCVRGCRCGVWSVNHSSDNVVCNVHDNVTNTGSSLAGELKGVKAVVAAAEEEEEVVEKGRDEDGRWRCGQHGRKFVLLVHLGIAEV